MSSHIDLLTAVIQLAVTVAGFVSIRAARSGHGSGHRDEPDGTDHDPES